MNARHLSQSNEHFTPPEIVERARAVLGRIDLDPASCEAANTIVRASRFYDAKENGFTKIWRGRVFLNPPGGFCDPQGRSVAKREAMTESSQRAWWFRLARLYDVGRVEAAIFVCFSIELLQTTQTHPYKTKPLDFPICFPKSRVDYISGPNMKRGGGPPHASCIVFLPLRKRGDDQTTMTERFFSEFSSLGRCIYPDASP